MWFSSVLHGSWCDDGPFFFCLSLWPKKVWLAIWILTNLFLLNTISLNLLSFWIVSKQSRINRLHTIMDRRKGEQEMVQDILLLLPAYAIHLGDGAAAAKTKCDACGLRFTGISCIFCETFNTNTTNPKPIPTLPNVTNNTQTSANVALSPLQSPFRGFSTQQPLTSPPCR